MDHIKIPRAYTEGDIANCLVKLFSNDSSRSQWWNILNTIHKKALWGRLK